MQNQAVSDSTKITKVKTIVEDLLNRGAVVILCSHLGRPQVKGKEGFSLEPIRSEAEKIIGREVVFVDEDFKNIISKKISENKKLFLLENIRFDPNEEKNGDELSKKLADLCDIYINEAFSCSHRKHASIFGITQFVDSYAGETIHQELTALNSIVTNTQKPVACLIGGSKISTKIDLITSLMPKIDYMIIGGAMANNFFKHQGFQVGKSKIEENIDSVIKNIIATASKNNCKLVLPIDVVTAKTFEDQGVNKTLDQVTDDEMILDIGTETIASISKILQESKTVFWNGPFGFFEKDNFANGTKEISDTVADLTKQGKLVSIAGGGDTFAAIKKSKRENEFTYISTAGGAFLEWLEGKVLPGLKVLEIKN
jgi:phosphoglycerate kinase